MVGQRHKSDSLPGRASESEVQNVIPGDKFTTRSILEGEEMTAETELKVYLPS